MKKISIIKTTFALFCAAFLFLANSTNPPNGRTGAPYPGNMSGNEPLCGGCHGGNNPLGLEGNLDIVGVPATIQPNTTYPLSVTITKTAGDIYRAGFQMLILDENADDAGTASNFDSETVETMSGGRRYIEHGSGAIQFGAESSVSYTFDWTSPNSITGNNITFYMVTVLGNGSGTAQDNSFTNYPTFPFATNTNPLSIITVNTTDPLCNNETDGSATVMTSGGNGTNTYSWSSGGNMQTENNLSPGNYTVTVSSGGESVSQPFTIDNPPAITASITSQTSIDCNNPTAMATVSATGGTGMLIYSWDNGDQTETATGLSAGNHSVTIFDSNQCQEVQTVNIVSDTSLPAAEAGPGASLGCVNNTVQLNGAGSDTGSNISYLWQTGNGVIMSGATTLTPTVSAAGTYTLTVTNNDNGCTSTDFVFVTSNNVLPVADAGQSGNLNCNNNTLQLDGSSSSQGDFSYLWTASNGGNIMFGETGLAPTVNSAGLYTLTVTNNETGCQSSNNVQVSADFTVPIVSIATPNQIGCSNSSVQIDGSASSSGGQFSYQWTTGDGGIESGANTAIVTVNLGGTYTLTVSNNSNGCTNLMSVTVTADTTLPIADAGQAMTLDCNINQVTLNGNGSSSGANFTYQWQGVGIVSGATTLTPTINLAGTYELTVTNNDNSCQSSSTVVVTEDTQVPNSLIASPDLLDCNETAISLDGSGSSQGANIVYQWTTSNGNIISGENALTLIVDATGEYCLTTTNIQNGCFSESCVTVSPATSPITSVSSQGMLTCNGDMDGFISVESTGGSGTYNYEWSTDATGPTIQGLGAGIYTVTTTDENQCSDILSIAITEPAALTLSLSSTSETGSGANDGTAMANGGGGTGELSYEWSNNETTQEITNLAPGTYSVTVTDENNCITIGEVSIGSFDCALVIEGITTNDAACNGEASGQASIDASSSSTLSYEWSSGGNMATETGLSAGTYTVTVTDEANCEAIQSVTISEPLELTILASPDLNICNSGTNANANITVNGGVEPYTLTFSDGGNGTNLLAGEYIVTVTDDNNCQAIEDFVVLENPAIVIQVTSTDLSSAGASDGTATVTATGSTTNFYTYLWSDGQTGSTAFNLSEGEYCVTVVDLLGCQETSCVSVAVSGCASLAGGTGSTSVSCNGFSDGTAFIDVTGGSGMYSYAWSSGGEEATETGLTAGLYFVTVTDTDDCSLIEEVTVDQPSALTVQLIEQNNIECAGQTSGSATVEANGGTAGYTYAWSNGGEGATQMNLAADTYEITATDANACQTVFSFSIIASDDVTLPTVITQNITIEAGEGVTIGAGDIDNGSFDNCGLGALTISQSTFNCDNLGDNEVTLFVTDINGNTNSAPAIVTVIDTTPPVAGCPTEYTVACDGTVDYEIGVSDNCDVAIVSIPAGLQSGNIFPVGTTTVTLELIDDSGNSDMCSFEIVVENVLAVTATGIDVSCNGGNDGNIFVAPDGGTPPYTTVIENGIPEQLSAGMYTLVVTDAEGCSTSTEVEISEPSEIIIDVNQVINEENTTGNGAIVIDVSGGTEGYTYSWTGPDNFISTEEDLLNLSAGDYVLVVTDANGCEVSSEVITIDNLTSIEEPIWAKNLRFFPNPASDILTLELPTFMTSDLTVELLNARGKSIQIIDNERNSDNLQMNVSNLPSGLYWVKMQMEGEFVVRKVVVE
jgi:hypothetical protein